MPPIPAFIRQPSDDEKFLSSLCHDNNIPRFQIKRFYQNYLVTNGSPAGSWEIGPNAWFYGRVMIIGETNPARVWQVLFSLQGTVKEKFDFNRSGGNIFKMISYAWFTNQSPRFLFDRYEWDALPAGDDMTILLDGFKVTMG